MRKSGGRIGGRAPLGVAAVLGVAALVAVTAGPARAQAPPDAAPSVTPSSPPKSGPSVELTPTIGWQWGGTLDYEPGDVHANAAINYGGSLGIMIRPGYWGEVSYSYQSTDLIARPATGPEFKLLDLGTHYIQLAGARNLMNADPSLVRAYPYVIGGMGMTIFTPGSPTVPLNVDTQYLFSMSAGVGVRAKLNERTEIRLQTRILLPMNFTEGSFYFGSGGGGVGVSGGTLMPQGEVTLGAKLRVTQ